MNSPSQRIDSLASDFSQLSLSPKEEAIDWLNTNFPDSPTKTSLLQHIQNPNLVLIDKFYRKKGDQVTFYVHVYNKKKKNNYCRHITLFPKSSTVTSPNVHRAYVSYFSHLSHHQLTNPSRYKKQKTISEATPLLSDGGN